MGASESPFKPFPVEDASGDLQALMARPRAGTPLPPTHGAAVSTARFHGFDLQDAPVLSGLARFPGELVTAQTTVPLRRAMIGAKVLVLHEDGDWTRPIVVGVLQEGVGAYEPLASPASAVDVRVDDERLTLTAEREIVLRCGDASITLTRAGKVMIEGNYILSRSRGYNKLKGAAIDIN